MRPCIFFCNQKQHLASKIQDVKRYEQRASTYTCYIFPDLLSHECWDPHYKATSGCSTSQSRVISIIIYSLEAAIKQSNECGCPPSTYPPSPDHTITTTTTLLTLAWHAINPVSPSHERLARKWKKKTADIVRKHMQSNWYVHDKFYRVEFYEQTLTVICDHSDQMPCFLQKLPSRERERPLAGSRVSWKSAPYRGPPLADGVSLARSLAISFPVGLCNMQKGRAEETWCWIIKGFSMG